MWPWQINLIYKKTKLLLSFDMDINIDLLVKEYEDLKKQTNQALHPDIYHNGGWYGILLHAQDGDINKKFSGSDGQYYWTEESNLTPYTKSLCESIGQGLKRVRYLTLMPGYKVHWHYDDDESFDSDYIRCHIPIVTNKMAIIWVGNQRIHMPSGKIMTCDFGFPHKLINLGEYPRTHLVFDVKKSEISKKFKIDFEAFSISNRQAKKISQALYNIFFNRLFQLKFYYRVAKNKIKNA